MTQTISQVHQKLIKLKYLLQEQIDLSEPDEPGFDSEVLGKKTFFMGIVAASLMNKYADKPAKDFNKNASSTLEQLAANLTGKRSDFDQVLQVLASVNQDE